MKLILRLLITFLIVLGSAAAQSAYLYVSRSSDGINVYADGVVQSSSWINFSAIHTYSQSLSVMSPSGRYNSCGFNNPVPASQSVYYECTASLPIAGEGGNYYISGSQRAVCSQVGQFAYAPLSSYVSVKFSVTGYTNSGDVPSGWVYTYNPSTCNCTCRAPNDITRPGNYPSWIIEKVVITVDGYGYCPGSQTFVDAGIPGGVSCGDQTVL